MPKAKLSKEDFPYAENYPVLWDWLMKREARCMWQQRVGPDQDRPVGMIECWLVGTRPVLVYVHARNRGWDLYTAPDTNNATLTIADAEARCGL